MHTYMSLRYLYCPFLSDLPGLRRNEFDMLYAKARAALGRRPARRPSTMPNYDQTMTPRIPTTELNFHERLNKCPD